MITLLLTIAVVGFIVWAITTLVPMPSPFKQVLIGLACLIVLVLVLQAFGVVGGFGSLKVR